MPDQLSPLGMRQIGGIVYETASQVKWRRRDRENSYVLTWSCQADRDGPDVAAHIPGKQLAAVTGL